MADESLIKILQENTLLSCNRNISATINTVNQFRCAIKAAIEEISFKIKQIHFWYFWEKQVSLTEFTHMSMGKQNLD